MFSVLQEDDSGKVKGGSENGQKSVTSAGMFKTSHQTNERLPSNSYTCRAAVFRSFLDVSLVFPPPDLLLQQNLTVL